MNPLARWIRAETADRANRLLDRLLLAAGMLSLGVLVAQFGWGGSGRVWPWSSLAGKLLLAFFFGQALLRLGLAARPWIVILRQKAHYAAALLSALVLAGWEPLARALHHHLPADAVKALLLAFLFISQLPMLASGLLRLTRDSSGMAFRFFNAGQLFALTFGGAVLAGALLLKLPSATHAPGSFAWSDAFFMSTSAVCVTGLATVDVASTFTPLGRCILLLLVQLGGLGIMSLTFLLGMLAAGGPSLRNRYAMQSLLEERSLAEVGAALRRILAFTLTLEALGAVLIYFTDRAAFGLPLPQRAFSAVFHAVSAFCNAGFSLHPAGFADPRLATHTPFLGSVMALIILGGLGFPVLGNLWAAAHARRHGLPPVDAARINEHTRIVLLATALLLALGAGVFLFEAAGPESGRPLHAAFLSTTARTAGFQTFDLTTLNLQTTVFLGILMFIGGSPGGTAGGVRTTAVAVLLLDVWRVLRGRESQVLFRRKISRQVRDRALATVLLSLGAIGAGATALRFLQPELPIGSMVFECVSAFGTVGLSLNLTPRLDPAGKTVIALLMFTGRIGILLLATSLLQRPDAGRLDYPRSTLHL